MIESSFNTSLGGIVAEEIKLTGAIGFSFTLTDGTNRVTVATGGDGTISIFDGVLTQQSHSTAQDHYVGIEIDLSLNTYRILHREGTTDEVWKTGSLTLSGDCNFYGLKMGTEDGDVVHGGYAITYAAGAKKPDGTTI